MAPEENTRGCGTDDARISCRVCDKNVLIYVVGGGFEWRFFMDSVSGSLTMYWKNFNTISNKKLYNIYCGCIYILKKSLIFKYNFNKTFYTFR